nr:hypothetical protein [uncultured Sphingomonas sp.]
MKATGLLPALVLALELAAVTVLARWHAAPDLFLTPISGSGA